MVPKESGFNQSVTASGMCARKALRFPGSPATMKDCKLLQMPHSCHHVETIRHPNSGYVTIKLYGTERLHVEATFIRYFQKEIF